MTDLHHLGLTVADIERSIVFYRDVLGMTLIRRRPNVDNDYVAEQTGYAGVVIATDLVNEKIVSPKEAVLLVDPEALSQLLSPGFDQAEWAKIPVLAKGLPASPGAASGQVVFTADTAVEWTRQGKQVILVRKETVPDDIHGMHVAQGILTATGGMTSHAAVVGRQMGKPSVVGAGALEIDEAGRQFRVDGKAIKEGDFISFDGLTGEVKIAARWIRRSRISTNASANCSSGPTRFAGSASAPTPICPIRRSWRMRSARGVSASAAPNTCSSAQIDCRSCSG